MLEDRPAQALIPNVGFPLPTLNELRGMTFEGFMELVANLNKEHSLILKRAEDIFSYTKAVLDEMRSLKIDVVKQAQDDLTAINVELKKFAPPVNLEEAPTYFAGRNDHTREV